MAQSLSDLFENVKPHQSKLEREKEQALQNSKSESTTEKPQVKTIEVASHSSFWTSVIKKRSRLEME